jgi:hypothetical protein
MISMSYEYPAKSTTKFYIPSLISSGRPVVPHLLPGIQSDRPFYLEADVGQGMPFFRWFPQDYAGDAMVRAMTDDQDLIYRRLLDMSWQIGPLPSEPEDLARLAGFELGRFEEAWRFPLTECWHLNGGMKLINHRLEEERESTLDRSVKARFAVQCREEKRAKRLKTKKKGSIIGRSSDVHLGAIHPDPEPDPNKKEKKRAPAPPPPAWHAGIKWNKEKNKAEVSEDAWREVSGQLQELARADGLPLLSNAEYKLSMNKLNGHLIGNPHKRGKTLPAIMRNWFETDMRTKAQRVGKQSPAAEELATEAAWEAERPDNAAEIAACEKELGPHEGRLTQRERYAFCGCGYRVDK